MLRLCLSRACEASAMELASLGDDRYSSQSLRRNSDVPRAKVCTARLL